MISGSVGIASKEYNDTDGRMQVIPYLWDPNSLSYVVSQTSDGVGADVVVTNTVAVTGPLTNAQLRASPVPVSMSGGSDATAANQVTEIAAVNAVGTLITALNALVATAAKQDTGNTSLATIAGKDFATQTTLDLVRVATQALAAIISSGRLLTDGSGVTQPVSAAALPLPAGASTAARQDTGNTTLATLATEATLLSRTKPADQQHVIIDSSAAIAVTGPLTDAQLRAAAVPVSGTVAVSGVATAANQTTEITRLDSLITELNAKTEPADQQHAIIDSSALPTGASTAARQDTGNTSLATIAAATDVALSTRLKAADTLAGITTVAAVTSITNPVAVTGPLTDAQLRATPVPVSGTVAVSGVATAANQATEIAALALLATEATLLTRTKPADQQHVIVDSAPASSTGAFVTDTDEEYVEDDTEPITQTVGGRLRVEVGALVSDAEMTYVSGARQPLSLAGDGRLRVITLNESYNFTPWGDPETFDSNMDRGALSAWPSTW